MMTMGATSVWERWDSMLEDGSVNSGRMTSFNHFVLGGVSPIEPGYAHFRFAPRVLPEFVNASVWHD